MLLMFHDDDCGELLLACGECPKCGIHPDMQSTAFRGVLKGDLRGGRTYLGEKGAAVAICGECGHMPSDVWVAQEDDHGGCWTLPCPACGAPNFGTKRGDGSPKEGA